MNQIQTLILGMLKIERTSKLVQGSAHRVGAWVKSLSRKIWV